MSLKVWLPLNGNLNNKGSSGLTFSNINSANTTVNSAGKIGKCYNNNSHSAGGLLSNKTISLGQNLSMFCWFKFTDLESSSSLGGGLVSLHRYSSNTGMGITIKYVSSTTGYLSVNTGNGSGRTYNTYCGTTLLLANTWYHGGYTYDGTNIRIYVNGICEKILAYSNMSVPADYLTVFCWSMSGTSGNSVHGDYKLNGFINDVRIYDHCLSQLEISELAKGLVIHYKLDNNGSRAKNLLPCGNTYTSSSPWTTTFSKIDGYKWIPNSAFEGLPLTTYTISVECDGTLASGHGVSANPSTKSWTFWLYICNVDTTKNWQTDTYDTPINLNSANYNYKKVGNTHTWVYTLSSTQKYISLRTNLYSNGTDNTTVNWWNMKIEEGNLFTGWSAYEGNSSNKIYDSSGYNNHGEVIGTIEINAETSKYSASANLTTTSSHVHISNLNVTGFTNSFSIAWWGKVSTYSNKMMWGFSDGNRLNGIYNGNLWNTGDSSNNPIYLPGTTTLVSAPSVNVWHHFVMTGNGTINYVYKDGELWGLSKTYKPLNGTSIYFNGWANSTDYTLANTMISDFRIYSTVLTAQQVYELYKAESSVDNKENIYARELVEE